MSARDTRGIVGLHLGENGVISAIDNRGNFLTYSSPESDPQACERHLELHTVIPINAALTCLIPTISLDGVKEYTATFAPQSQLGLVKMCFIWFGCLGGEKEGSYLVSNFVGSVYLVTNVPSKMCPTLHDRLVHEVNENMQGSIVKVPCPNEQQEKIHLALCFS